MGIESVNPVTGERERQFAEWGPERIEQALAQASSAAAEWRGHSFASRVGTLKEAARLLRQRVRAYGEIITREMGKPLREAMAEVEKCATGCDYYAENGPGFLSDEIVETDASRSLVAYEPLGPILAIMPWNFPFWQVFRFAAPALMAGNVALLKHASNVPQCALAIEDLWARAGAPPGVFQSLMISSRQAEQLIADPRIRGVSLTGSETAGRQVAALAGAHLKKTVLELGGSDAFIVLADADLDLAASAAASSRYMNGGQSCIAAKRFIVVSTIADEFLNRFKTRVSGLTVGNPLSEEVMLGPMARADLRDTLHAQVQDALAQGARLVLGGQARPGRGYFYEPTILDQITPAMRAWREELFGPVALVIRVKDEKEAIAVANSSPYGLGGSVWTRDATRGEELARLLETGSAFVNGLVKSDPRLPFGGVKASGHGRELSVHGMREFLNIKTVWIR